MKAAIPLNQCLLYKCGSKRSLAKKLQVSTEQLSEISDWRKYHIFELEKRPGCGETRTINAPEDELKKVQGRIQHLLQRIEKPSWVYSGSKGVCHIDNAFSHEGNRYFLLADIASFYERCNREAVYRLFRDSLRCAPDVADLLATITTYEREDGSTLIPTGSPCSQLVAYFAYQRMFEEIAELAKSYGCQFSLYVDDLTFSSSKPIRNPRNLEKELARVLKAYGHKIKWEKTGYYGADRYKLITGVALDKKGSPRIPNQLGKKIMDGMQVTLEGDRTKIASTIGRIGAARQIVTGAFPEAARIVSLHS